MRDVVSPSIRRILCVFPRYSPSFGTFEYAYPLTDGVQAFMPPQGLLLIAALVSGVVLYAPFMRRLPFGAVRVSTAWQTPNVISVPTEALRDFPVSE